MDRPLPRAPPPGNFDIDYDSFEIKIPNYAFGKAVELVGAGGLIAVSIGKRLKDNKVVLAKISPHSVRLEREYYVTKRLYSLPSGDKYVPNAIEYVSLVQDGLAALLYTDIEPNDYIYIEQQQTANYFTLYSLTQMTHVNVWKDHQPEPRCQVNMDVFLLLAIECCSALQFLHENGVVHGELRPSAFQFRYTPNKQQLIAKTVDERYDSAYGLREDLVECKKRLATVDSSQELAYFPLGSRDINPVFKISDAMYGRDKEIETIGSIIQSVYHAHQKEKKKTQPNGNADSSSALKQADNLLRVNSSTSLDNTICEVIVLKGPGGIGKSTLVSTLNVQARQCGYTASAKFDKNQKRPYNGLLRCLSSILRQLLTESEHVVRDFYKDLKESLGPQFSNVRLMVNMVPELKPILHDYLEVNNTIDDDAISSILNTETRFHSVYLNIIRTIARRKLLTLCLDDLQEADEPSIRLINALISSKTTMLVILTFRDGNETPQKVVEILEKCSNPVTTIQLYALGIEVLQQLVLNTFYNSHHSWTRGNPFYAKQFLKMMKRKDDIWFDWNEKHWKFRLDNIKKLFDTKQTSKRPSHHDLFMLDADTKPSHQAHNEPIFDVRHLVSHLRSLDPSAQCFLMWASLLGHVFNFRRIKWLMMASSDNPKSVDSPVLAFEQEEERTNQAMLGLQVALNEGVIQFKAGNDFHFIHDRYYQAASMLIIDSAQRESMHLKIGQMLMLEEEELEEDDNVFLIADHFLKSAGLIRLMEKRKCYRDMLIRAGNEAALSGALQISASYFECALSLLDQDTERRWQDGPDTSFSETLNLYMKILELKLLNNKDINQGYVTTTNKKQEQVMIDKEKIMDTTTSIVADGNKLVTATTFIMYDRMRDDIIQQIMQHTVNHPYERAQAWRIQARIYFQQSQYRKGIQNIMEGLEELGIVVDTNITEAEVLEYYHIIKASIVEPGFEQLNNAGPCQDNKQIAVMTLLNEACSGAYWVNPILVDFFALKLCELSLQYGYTPSSGGGFIWVGCTASRVTEFAFAAELGKFGLALCEKYAANSEIARAIILYHSLLAQWTGVHVRDYIYQYQRAYKYAIAGGDQLFSSMALFHVATTLYWTSCNLFDLHWHLSHSLEECSKGSSKDVLILNVSLWRSVLVFQGKTDITQDPDKMMNDPDSNFDESSFVEDLKSQSVNSGNPLNWHYSFKMILLFHFGFTKAASELGFKIFDNSFNEIVHRHVGIAMYYHCIAI
ncbi:hypothetical protein CU098_009048, partial [Rhizopus stolonifer]